MGSAILLHPVLPGNPVRRLRTPTLNGEQRPGLTRPLVCLLLFSSQSRCRREPLLRDGRSCLFPWRCGGAGKQAPPSLLAVTSAAGVSPLPTWLLGNSSPECRRFPVPHFSAAAALPPGLLLLPLVFFLLLFLILLLCGVRVPGEALLVERNHHLGTLDVGLLGRNQVGLVGVLPASGVREREKRRRTGLSALTSNNASHFLSGIGYIFKMKCWD